MPLSRFVSRYCKQAIKESVVHWYQTYDRMTIKTGLLELITSTKPDFRMMDNHFKDEVDKLLEILIEGE
jgi:hypothetical protein